VRGPFPGLRVITVFALDGPVEAVGPTFRRRRRTAAEPIVRACEWISPSGQQVGNESLVAQEQRNTAEVREHTRVLGIVADPDMSTQVGLRITDRLVEWLNEKTDGSWKVEVCTDPVAAGESDTERVLNSIEHHRRENSWSYGVCITDLPLFKGGSPVLSEIDDSNGVAFISLPALGSLMPGRRLWRMLTIAVSAILAPEWRRNGQADPAAPQRVRFGAVPFVRSLDEGSRDAIRYAAKTHRGWLALLAGMVLANRPWGLVLGLSSALATSLATSAFGLSSSTLWQIGDQLDPVRKVLTAVLSVALLVFWLIVSHHLWERRQDSAQLSLTLPALYNSSTVVSLSVGVMCMYVSLFLLNVGVAYVLIPESLLAQTLQHGVGLSSFLKVAWSFTAIGMLAGALGTSLESDRAVRQAAYGYRERQRRAEYRHKKKSEEG
jgi:hypothetical protein